MDTLKFVENQLKGETKIASFKAGDTVTVHYKIKEGEKERIQQFQGVVLQRRGAGVNETFTVRKMSNGIGVERIFPVYSPFIDKVEINKRGQVRRARIFYLRERTGKSARIKERISAKYVDQKKSASETKKAAAAKHKEEKHPVDEVVDNKIAAEVKPQKDSKAEAKKEVIKPEVAESKKEETTVKSEEAK